MPFFFKKNSFHTIVPPFSPQNHVFQMPEGRSQILEIKGSKLEVRGQKSESQKHEVIVIRMLRAAPSAPSFRFATAPKPHTAQKKPPVRHVTAEPAAVLSLIVGEIVRFISPYQVFRVAFSGHQPRDRLLLQKCRPLCLQTNRHAVALQA